MINSRYILAQIPKGNYCYNEETKKLCPFWHLRADKPDQNNGFCAILDTGDWQLEDSSLLWDQVKICEIKTNSQKNET